MRDKLIGLLLAPVLVVACVLAAFAAFDGRPSEDAAFVVGPDPTWAALVAVVVLSGPLAALYLSSRLRQAAAG